MANNMVSLLWQLKLNPLTRTQPRPYLNPDISEQVEGAWDEGGDGEA